MKTVYKLTDPDMRTHGGCQWKLGEWKKRKGEEELCGPGWLHHYSSPLLAVMLNPIHADIPKPRMFRGEARGKHKNDHGLKGGSTQLRLVEELALPKVTTEQRIRFGILCAKRVCANAAWNAWADKWLSGEDRTRASADAADAAAYAAAHTADATADAADYAAAHAAAAATDAADATADAAWPSRADASADAADAAAYAAAHAAATAATAAYAATHAATAATDTAADAAYAAAHAADAAAAAAAAWPTRADADADAACAAATLDLDAIAQEAVE